MPFKLSSGFPANEDKEVLPVAGLSLMTPVVEVDPSNTNSKCGDGDGGGTGSGAGSGSTLLTDSMRLQSKSQQQPLQQGIRKQRRCWSPELHRRFVNALQQLGGSQGQYKFKQKIQKHGFQIGVFLFWSLFSLLTFPLLSQQANRTGVKLNIN